MKEKKHTPSYTAEFRARGVRLFRDHRSDYSSDSAAYRAIASKLCCSSFSRRDWYRRAARDAGELSGPTSEEKARIKALERENRELRQANEILRKGTFHSGPPRTQMRLRGWIEQRAPWLRVADGKPDDDRHGCLDGLRRFRTAACCWPWDVTVSRKKAFCAPTYGGSSIPVSALLRACC